MRFSKAYTLEGITCDACVARITKELVGLPYIVSVDVLADKKSANISMEEPVDLSLLQQAVSKAGHYHIAEQQPATMAMAPDDFPEKSLQTYKPLLLIVAFIAGVTACAQFPFSSFSAMLWMRHFMAGFFIVFSFFKFLNLRGFADSYRMYDIVAMRWQAWGFIYPFVELALGLMYLVDRAPTATNWATVAVLGVSSIGVIKSNLDKKQIKCACLGDVFNLPMSTVTIVEDLSMVFMALAMLWTGRVA